MRPLPTAADPVPGSAGRPKRDPGSVQQAPRGLVVMVNRWLGSEVADLQVKCYFFLADGAKGSGLSLMETPDPGSRVTWGRKGEVGAPLSNGFGSQFLWEGLLGWQSCSPLL